MIQGMNTVCYMIWIHRAPWICEYRLPYLELHSVSYDMIHGMPTAPFTAGYGPIGYTGLHGPELLAAEVIPEALVFDLIYVTWTAHLSY